MRTSVALHGIWQVTVVRKESDWAQRVVATGSETAVLPGVLGASAAMGGGSWRLTVEHDYGAGWRPSEYVHADDVQEDGGRATRVVTSKDHYWPGDSHPDDLVLRLDHAGAAVQVAVLPRLVGEELREDSADARFLAVTVRNSGYRAFGYEAVFDVTDAGRAALAQAGVVLAEDWDPAALRATGQEAYGRAVCVPPLEAGGQGLVYFPVLEVSADGVAHAVDVEFVLARDRPVAERIVARLAVPPALPAVRPSPSGLLVPVHAATRPPVGRPRPGAETTRTSGASAS